MMRYVEDKQDPLNRMPGFMGASPITSGFERIRSNR